MIAELGLAGVYLVLTVIAFRRRTHRSPAEWWLIGFSAFSALLMGLHAIFLSGQLSFSPALPGELIAVLLFMISVIMVGFLTLTYLTPARDRRLQAGWGVLGAIWLATTVLAIISRGSPAPGTWSWLSLIAGSGASLVAQSAAYGWSALTAVLLGLTGITFLREPTPLHANRVLFWAVLLPFLLLGDALSAWFAAPWTYMGYLFRLAGTVGAVYGVTARRIVDVRATFRWGISRSILTLMTGVLALGGILMAEYVRLPWRGPVQVQRWVIIGSAALLVAILHQPLRQLLRWLLRDLIIRDTVDSISGVRLYSQRISDVIELRELAEIVIQTINDQLGTRRGYLILATPENERVTLEIVGGIGGEPPTESGMLSPDNPLCEHWLRTGQPVLQYDLDFLPDYRDMPADERQYFRSLGLAVYAPIVDGSKLLGLIAVGTKMNDDPFWPREMELLGAIANQTVVALENARLVADLRRLNLEIGTLNRDLLNTNQQLERLDEVKSDFITIASHELRTPLAQVQGYADLLLEMAERNMLDRDQTQEIASVLSKASERLTDVIHAMSEVSQISVQNLDLNLVETSLANIIKLAITQYADAIHERNLTLVARGLRNLPPIHADYQRIVKAFQNLLTNAIKFTPDGGKINITGEIFERSPSGEPVSVRIKVEDTGIGIAPEHHDLVFEKFYRVGSTALHSSGTTKFKGAGPGLGLPIARGIIEGHGGRIWVDSPGYDEESCPGCTFHVILPLRPPMMVTQERMAQFNDVSGAGDAETQQTSGDVTRVIRRKDE